MHHPTRLDDTTTIVRQYASGEDRAFEELYRRCKYALIRLASQTIARQHLSDVCIDAEVIVDMAFFNLRAARCHGDLAQTDDSKGLHRLLLSNVRREITRERIRAQALRRGGRRVTRLPLNECAPEVLDSLVTPASEPEDLLAREEFERLCDLLDRPIQKEILTMRYEGYSIQEICARIKRTRRSLQLHLAVIRQVYEKSRLPRA
jgi:DNA-directed RNA polymerase specialized sigma24 family protein